MSRAELIARLSHDEMVAYLVALGWRRDLVEKMSVSVLRLACDKA